MSMSRRAMMLLALLSACDEASNGGATNPAAPPTGATTDSAVGAVDAAPGAGRPDSSVASTGGGGLEAGAAAPDANGGVVRNDAAVTQDAAPSIDLPKFSFFVTSLASLRKLSNNQSGFGGDLRFGETGDGAGLRGADKICTTIAETSLAGSSAKQWRAFLSTSKVHAKDRIGTGPWYDRQGRLLAMNLTALLKERPEGARPEIINDFPNEFGVPNHNPDGTGNVDNHDMLTGSNAMGMLYTTTDGANHNCEDWTSAAGDNTKRPRVGHSWPRNVGGATGGGFTGGGFPPGFIGGGQTGGGGGFAGLGTEDGTMNNWMSALNEAGCAPGVSLVEMGPPMTNTPTVGSGGGYGGFYCFALTP